MSAQTAFEIVGAIDGGAVDEQLDMIAAAISARRKTVAFLRSLSLKVGDRCQLADRMKPMYLAGLTGVVVALKGDKFEIRLDHPQLAGRYVGPGGVVTAPRTIVQAEE